jgi:hypothetical protein
MCVPYVFQPFSSVRVLKSLGDPRVMCLWRWLFGPPSPVKASLMMVTYPEFEFRPAPDFLATMACGAQFVIANPLDLFLQQRGLMADCLVVEINAGSRQTVLWLQYNWNDLATVGRAECTLFAGDSDRVFGGVCGFICNKKKI